MHSEIGIDHLIIHHLLHLQLEELDDWVNPVYLDIGVQHQIRRQFEKESQIQLPDFFLVCGLSYNQNVWQNQTFGESPIKTFNNVILVINYYC